MKEKNSRSNPSHLISEPLQEDNLSGYPEYPSKEDIYGKFQKDRNINPEDPSGSKETFYYNKAGKFNEKDFNDDVTGSDLDIPGSELDDDLELIGSEDEENNYYSLGGDGHTDLDEDNLELDR